MNAGMSAHVVLLAWIGKEVGLRASLDTGIEERQTVLRYNGVVVIARNNLQLTLQVASLVDEAGLLVPLRILLGCVHIAFTIHHLVPFPVDDRTTGHTHLEDVGIVQHERDGHETAKRPPVDTQAIHVNIRQALQIFHALHLVLHLNLSQLAEGSLFEVTSTIFRATIVEDEQHIALLCHVGLPRTTVPVPASLHIVSMRTTIHIDNGRIFLLWIEVVWLYHAVVEVRHTIGSLDGTTLEDGLFVILPWVGGGQETHGFPCS